MQIGDIRDMLSNGVEPGTVSPSTSHRSSSSSGGGDIASYMREALAGSSGSSGLSGYEAMKAGLLANEPGGHSQSNDESQTQDEAPPEQAVDQFFTPTGPEFEDAPLADPPTSIDVANAGIEDLRLAVEERDSYILYVLQRLRNAESRSLVSNNWAHLETVPTELRVHWKCSKSSCNRLCARPKSNCRCNAQNWGAKSRASGFSTSRCRRNANGPSESRRPRRW
jgi:hypothetical protein